MGVASICGLQKLPFTTGKGCDPSTCDEAERGSSEGGNDQFWSSIKGTTVWDTRWANVSLRFFSMSTQIRPFDVLWYDCIQVQVTFSRRWNINKLNGSHWVAWYWWVRCWKLTLVIFWVSSIGVTYYCIVKEPVLPRHKEVGIYRKSAHKVTDHFH